MEKLKKYWPVALIAAIALIAILVFAIFSIRGGSGGEDVYEDIPEETMDEEVIDLGDGDSGIVFEEEAEDADLTFKQNVSEEDFYGSWSATSSQAIYLYGNVDLKIEKGGKWTGNIVDEDMSGTWTYDGSTMTLTGEYLDAKLSFEENGSLIMQEDRGEEGEPDIINTVLTKN